MNLVYSREPGGYRHYLDGKPVHCGAFLDLQLGGPARAVGGRALRSGLAREPGHLSLRRRRLHLPG